MTDSVIPRLLTAKELAERWNVSETWVLERVPSIRLHGLRRFEEQAVQEWLEQQKEPDGEVVELRSVTG